MAIVSEVRETLNTELNEVSLRWVSVVSKFC